MNALAVADSPVLADDASLVRRLLVFLPKALPGQRADAVNALARAYLHCDMQQEARADALIALTRALDDPEPRVRRALAEAFADTREAPRHIVLALAGDVSEVSRPVLAQSPLLSEADLVDAAAGGDVGAQIAIARRAGLRAPVAAALAEIGERGAALALIGNCAAEVSRPALWRMFERFAADGEVRERLVERPGLPASLRAAIAAATTTDMSDFASQAAWLDPRRAARLARDGREQAFATLAAQCAREELPELAAWLRQSGHLTVGLLLRSLAGGDVALLAHSLADLSATPVARAAGFVADARGQGFAALYARAKMPGHLLPAFRIAVACAAEAGGAGIGVQYPLTMAMLRAIEALREPALEPIVAMLWRLAGEGARADARDLDALTVEPVEDEAPQEIGCDAPPVLLLGVEAGNENFAPAVFIDEPQFAAA